MKPWLEVVPVDSSRPGLQVDRGRHGTSTPEGPEMQVRAHIQLVPDVGRDEERRSMHEAPTPLTGREQWMGERFVTDAARRQGITLQGDQVSVLAHRFIEARRQRGAAELAAYERELEMRDHLRACRPAGAR